MITETLEFENAISMAAERAHVLFEKYGWEYFDGPPTVPRLKKTLRNLLEDMDRYDTNNMSTGRFVVRRFPSDGLVEVYLDLAQFSTD